jgi:flagellar motor switch protein FliM
MNPESDPTPAPEGQVSFLDAEVSRAEAAEGALNDSLASFLEGGPAEGSRLPADPRQVPPLAKRAGAQSYDFRNPALLSPGQLHRLQAHQEEFTHSMAARLSAHLRSEFALKIAGLQTTAYQRLAQGWKGPSHLSLFKMEPLRGVALLDISYHLGMAMIDRLMGGSGNVTPTDQELSEIEKVLLEQTVQLFLNEWCAHWNHPKPLKPVLLGYENFGGFIQTIPLETMLFVVTFQAEFGEAKGLIQAAVPYASMEPLIRQHCQSADTVAPAPAATLAAPVRWNPCFDDVPVPITAEWDGLEMTARQILALKVGDVLPLAARTQYVNVRVADTLRFQGRPGTLAGQWAVELTRVLKP